MIVWFSVSEKSNLVLNQASRRGMSFLNYWCQVLILIVITILSFLDCEKSCFSAELCRCHGFLNHVHCFKHSIPVNVSSGGRLRHSYLLRLAMDVWLGKTHLSSVISTRLDCFLQRKERRLKYIVLFKWWHRIVNTKRARTLRMMLLTKIERRCKEWAFQVVKKKVSQKALVEALCVQRTNKTRY